MFRQYSILAFFILSIQYLSVAQTFRIFGKIMDSESNETLIGVSIFNKKDKNGAMSNEYGFYSLAATEGWLN